jgi:hypothetical protein
MPNFLGIAFIDYYKMPLYVERDVIVFKGHNNREYAHRIISVSDDSKTVTTKGDNFTESKPYEINIPLKNIHGLVTSSIPDFYKPDKKEDID